MEVDAAQSFVRPPPLASPRVHGILSGCGAFLEVIPMIGNAMCVFNWKWIAVRNVDGSVTLRSALAEGMVLDVSAGRMSNGANIQLYASNGTNAQKWTFRQL